MIYGGKDGNDFMYIFWAENVEDSITSNECITQTSGRRLGDVRFTND